MCDFRDEVLGNMTKNCEKNGIRNISCFKVNLDEFEKYAISYDTVLCPDLLNYNFHPQIIVNIMRKLLRDNGEAIMIMP